MNLMLTSVPPSIKLCLRRSVRVPVRSSSLYYGKRVLVGLKLFANVKSYLIGVRCASVLIPFIINRKRFVGKNMTNTIR